MGVSVVDSGRETPGPIPNPEAKPTRADGTAPGRVWESKTPPTFNINTTEYQSRPRAPYRWRGVSSGFPDCYTNDPPWITQAYHRVIRFR